MDAVTRTQAGRAPGRLALPTLRQALYQLHWLLGIVAGTVLVVIGLSGAALSFHEELLDLLTPHGRHVAPRATPSLSPAELVQTIRPRIGAVAISSLTYFAEPGAAARITLAPQPGERKGQSWYADPYTGELLAPMRGAEFFEWIESLHRWLLLPRETGRVALGVLALALMLLALSGLYLRWPRRPLQWRAWLTFNTRLKGRAFLYGLHSVAGTCALLIYLLSTSTGVYWAFDGVRDTVDAWAGEPRKPALAAKPIASPQRTRTTAQADLGALDLASAWSAFASRTAAAGTPTSWSETSLRIAPGGAPGVLFIWLDRQPAHERARNRMTVQLPDGTITQDDRYAAKGAGGRFLAAIYPLHMGTYFGLPGRVVMTAAALMLPVFFITGWMLYMDRRRKKKRYASAR